jgi:hypothetical protein
MVEFPKLLDRERVIGTELLLILSSDFPPERGLGIAIGLDDEIISPVLLSTVLRSSCCCRILACLAFDASINILKPSQMILAV